MLELKILVALLLFYALVVYWFDLQEEQPPTTKRIQERKVSQKVANPSYGYRCNSLNNHEMVTKTYIALNTPTKDDVLANQIVVTRKECARVGCKHTGVSVVDESVETIEHKTLNLTPEQVKTIADKTKMLLVNERELQEMLPEED